MSSGTHILDDEAWQFVREITSAAHVGDLGRYRNDFLGFDDSSSQDKILAYLVYLVSQQLWYLSPDSLDSAKVREIAEGIYPKFSKFTYVNVDGLNDVFLSAFGQSDYGKNLGTASFCGLLSIALGQLVDDVDEAMSRMRPRLEKWCLDNGFAVAE